MKGREYVLNKQRSRWGGGGVSFFNGVHRKNMLEGLNEKFLETLRFK